MTDRLRAIEPRFVEFIPEDLEGGVLYVSRKYQTATHLCACGCKERVVTSLGPLGWTLSEADAGISLRPSIGNSNFPCRSHYWIREGGIEWAPRLTGAGIEASRERDRTAKEQYFSRRGGLFDWLRRLLVRVAAAFGLRDRDK